jgi:ferredoxin-NADP reductase
MHDQAFAADTPSTPGLLDVVIARREDVGEGVIALDLVAPHGAALPAFRAGAHVDVHVAPKLVRQYSLCGDPADRRAYRLGVKLEPSSRGGSASIHRDLAVGMTITIGEPRNAFPLVASASRTFLIAGGIGITPMLAMAAELDRAGADFDLRYCARSRRAAAFCDELENSAYAQRVRVHLDDAAANQRFDVARDTPAFVAGAHLYVCGPGPLISAVTEAARQKGWPQGQLHHESFAAMPAAPGNRFEVRAARSGVTVVVENGQSIAEALRSAGVDVELSCEQGVCGTCLLRVLDGTPDHRDVYQTDDEMASNDRIAACCSRAKSPRLVLDV